MAENMYIQLAQNNEVATTTATTVASRDWREK